MKLDQQNGMEQVSRLNEIICNNDGIKINVGVNVKN